MVGEWRGLRRSELWPDAGAPAGDGRAVVLVHGFGVPARTLAPLGRWLAAGGWDVVVPRLGWNLACGTRAVEVVLAAAEGARRRTGRPVVLVGHSRGGLLGRVAAVREPGLFGNLVTVCTPWAIGPPDRPGVAATTRAVRFVRRRGIDVLGSVECDTGACCVDFRRQMDQVPATPWTALWSSVDTIGGEQSAPPGGAGGRHDLGTSHLGAVLSVAGWSAIARALDADGEPGQDVE